MATAGTVIFAHGRESGPWGTKITRLAAVAREAGWACDSPDFQFSLDPGPRIPHLIDSARGASGPLVLAGSSLGGYVCVRACDELAPRGLFLMAPALYFPGHEDTFSRRPPHCAVIHGLADDIVPVERAQRFADEHGSELHLIDSGHTLNDRLDLLAVIFGEFLEKVISSD